MKKKLMIGWTTVSTEREAEELANGLVQEGFAACVQIDGPIRSFYRWKGDIKSNMEYRLTVKFPGAHNDAITKYFQKHHPYETPAWIAFKPKDVLPAYHLWALKQTEV